MDEIDLTRENLKASFLVGQEIMSRSSFRPMNRSSLL